ncbi:hypothetical protein ABN763_04620 [Spongiivirga sp. MCCC 1A20706]|uniref:hypothetical protein n=1 Tax=Spongiivirga sp. MCCC 1A20706 TaxID=3160963 RepID=UPI0039773F77
MDIVAGVFILVGTAIGIWANEINKRESDNLEKKNSILRKELKEISEENLRLSKKMENYVESSNYFNKTNFSYLKKDFPLGYTVVKQNEDFDDFVQAFGEHRDYEYYGSRIYRDKETQDYLIVLKDFKININGVSISGGETGVKIDPDNYKDYQLLMPQQPLLDVNMVILMIDSKQKYTYAIGLIPKINK